MQQKVSVRALAVLAVSVMPMSLAVSVAGVGLAGAAAAGTPGRVALGGSRPEWASAAVGAAPRTKTVNARIYLRARHEAELTKLVAAVSDPADAQYRHFLTPTQYRSQFGPTADSVTAVRRWLSTAGLTVTAVGAGNRYVAVRGSVTSTEEAFDAPLAVFHHDGTDVQAPARDVTVPADLAGTVLSVSGLDESDHRVHPRAAQAPPPDGFRSARPCSAHYGQLSATHEADGTTPLPAFAGGHPPYAVCGYVPSQLRAAYQSGTALTGAGATVAITDAYAAPTIRRDADTYARRRGDRPFRTGQFSQVRPNSYGSQATCSPNGWYGEETLDVEAVHAMAPDANIVYYASRTCNDPDFLDALGRVVDDNTASIVTNSWGDLESVETAGGVRAYQAVFLQGAAQGIGFFFSSGDNGDELATSGQRQADYPASDPYVTAVGGTSLAVGQGGYQFETGWGTNIYNLAPSGQRWQPQGFAYGAGGGISSLFRRPAYQAGVVPPGARGRAVPDVGLDADPTTGMLVGETQTFPRGVGYGEYRIGGTSLASPLMAGLQALATQESGRLGFANPRIYQLARSGSGAFRDVTAAHDGAANVRPDYVNRANASGGVAYSVRTFGDDSSLHTGAGWDDVTGVGSPTAAYLGG